MSKFLFVMIHALVIGVCSRVLNDTTDFYFSSSIEHSNIDTDINRGNCTICPPGWGVKKHCTPHASTECERCIVGKTYSSQYSNRRQCWPCSKCGIGLYEARKCSGKRDTVCDDCMRFIYKPELKNNNDFQKNCGYLFLGKRGHKIMDANSEI